MKSSFLKGTLIITAATLVSKLLGSLFRIPLQNIAGDEVLGIFSLVYPLYMVALILSVAGIPLAISRLISEARVTGTETDIHHLFVSSGILAMLFGVLSFSVLFVLSEPISLLLGGDAARYAVMIVSFTLLVAPYMAVYRGFFQGFQDMKPTAISQVLEQFVRVALILVIAVYLVKVGASAQWIAGGIMTSSFAGAFVSFVYLRRRFVHTPHRPISRRRYQWKDFKHWAKRILTLSLPIAFGSLTMALLNLVDSFTIPLSLAVFDEQANVHDLYGLYGRGLAVVQIATVFATSLVLPLIPSVAEDLAKKDHTRAADLISRSQTFNHLLSWPAAFGLFVLALPVNVLLFGDGKGTLVLALVGFSSLFQSFTVLGIGILQGIQRDQLAAVIVLFGVILKIGLNVLFVPTFGLTGAALSTIVVYFGLAVSVSYSIRKSLQVRLFSRKTRVFPITSIAIGVVLAGVTGLLGDMLITRAGALLYLLVTLPLGAFFYILFVMKWGGIKKEEFRDLPLIGRLLK